MEVAADVQEFKIYVHYEPVRTGWNCALPLNALVAFW
jgi:hypothetical protein